MRLGAAAQHVPSWLPPRAPSISIKNECLSKLVLLGENHLRRVVSQYIEHCHRERNHQGVDNRLLTPAEPASRSANENAPVERHERLGGLLNFYYRPAA